MTRLGQLLITLLEPLKSQPKDLEAVGLTIEDIDTAIRVIKVIFTL